MNEAERKLALALEAAGGRLVTSRPADVRWLLCGRGRPVETGGADYTVVLDGAAARVLFADIEEPRVREEERLGAASGSSAPWREGQSGVMRVQLHADLTMLARLGQALIRARTVPVAA